MTVKNKEQAKTGVAMGGMKDLTTEILPKSV